MTVISKAPLSLIEPPTAAGLPVIGNTLSFLSSKGLPVAFFQQAAQEHGDIVQFKLAGQALYLIAHPDLAHEVLVKRVHEFDKVSLHASGRRGLSRFLHDGILTANYEQWRPQRKLIQPLMHSQQINNYAETMVAFGEKLSQIWAEGGTRNIHADMMQVTMWIIAETMFGMDATHTPELEAVAHEAQSITVADLLTPLPDWLTGRERRAEAVNKVLSDLVVKFMAERRNQPNANRQDLLALLMETQDEDGNTMPEEFVRDNILTLFFAGHETTANTLTWAFYYLDQNPEVAAKLHEELDRVLAGRAPHLADLAQLPYTLMVIKETMRIEPTVSVFPRLVHSETSLQNHRLKENGVVLISPYVMHHDARWWDKPEAFNPERFSAENEAKIPKYAYLPFGGGPRVCIGNQFALMEAQILLALLVSRYQPRHNASKPTTPLRQVTTSPEDGLFMQIERR